MFIFEKGNMDTVDGNMAFNATLSVVSHSGVHCSIAREMVREAYEGRFRSSYEQKKSSPNEWPIEASGCERSGEEEERTVSEFF